MWQTVWNSMLNLPLVAVSLRIMGVALLIVVGVVFVGYAVQAVQAIFGGRGE